MIWDCKGLTFKSYFQIFFQLFLLAELFLFEISLLLPSLIVWGCKGLIFKSYFQIFFQLFLFADFYT
ncbi:hypothetical protein DTQ70_28690 [Runella sp. SP2]|nr:hypothetical protein DTQ70_28690 [Runella sp. SP2]